MLVNDSISFNAFSGLRPAETVFDKSNIFFLIVSIGTLPSSAVVKNCSNELIYFSVPGACAN